MAINTAVNRYIKHRIRDTKSPEIKNTINIFVHNNVFVLQVLACYMAKIVQRSVWPLAFIPRGQTGSVDWLGEEVCASGPKMDRVLENLMREGGDIALPEYVTIQREDGSSISLGPCLTQPCTSNKSGVFEVVELVLCIQ